MIALPAGLELAHFAPRHREAVADLLRRLWSDDPRLNASYFDWRHGGGAPGGESLVFVLLRQGVPVGMRALQSTRWRAGVPGDCQVFLADDLVISREWEGHGLVAALTAAMRAELAARGHDFFLSLSALRVTRHQALKLGAHAIGPMQPLGRLSVAARSLDRVRALAAGTPLAWRWSAGTAAHELAGRFFARLDAARTPYRGGSGGSDVVVEAGPRAADMAAFVADLPDDGRIRQVRDARFFAWRYANPLHEYRFVRAERHGRLCGYLIVERALADLANPRRSHIVDWEAESRHVFADLLHFVMAEGRPAELVAWKESGSADGRGALMAEGFRPIDRAQVKCGLPAILLWPVDPGVDPQHLRIGTRPLLALENWDVRLADTSYA